LPSTRVIAVDPDRPDPAALALAAATLRAGGLVAFATETVYGLGADATSPEAVARIFEAKGRPATNPLIVHVEDKAAARALVASWPDRAEALADRFWPGPLTLVLPRSAIIPDIVTAGTDTVGVRVPGPAVARGLIAAAGRPIAAPSANRSTGISPTRAGHVLHDLDGKVDLILDSGPTTIGLESTVLDLSDGIPRILRPGEITRARLVEVLGDGIAVGRAPAGAGAVARSPGQMAIHYAPITPTFRLERDRPVELGPTSGRHAFIEIGPSPQGWPVPPGSPDTIHRLPDPAVASRALYDLLHRLDEAALDGIFVLLPPDAPEWEAIRDRVWRATRPWPGGANPPT